MWPLLLVPIVLLGGCSLFSDDSKPSGSGSATPPPKPAEKDLPYRRSCLLDETCPPEERKASIYDYVGAVYGEKGKVQFLEADGKQKLSVLEKHYVEEKFGRILETNLTEPKGLHPYLSNAKTVFFADLKFPPDYACASEPNLGPLKWVHPKFASADLLYGRHGCGLKYADQFLKSGVELSVAAEPENWAFFLESYGTETFAKVKLEEMELFTRMADTLKIPLKNALPFEATSLEVRKEAAKGSKYTAEDFAVALVFQVAYNASLQNPAADPRKIFESVIDAYAAPLKMDRTDLFESTRLYLRKYPLLKDQAEESDRRGKILAETSNRMSKAGLLKELKAQAQEGKTQHNLFVVGANHTDLIRSVYADKKP